MKNALLVSLVFFMALLVNCKPDKPFIEPPKDIVTKKKLDFYTEVQYGNMPLIISVPHGGTDDPSSISDRTCPNITTVTDSRTIELANAIEQITYQYGNGIVPNSVLNAYLKLRQHYAVQIATENV